MVTNAESADLLLPLLQRARLADRWQLRTGLIKMQVFGVRADLLFGQKEGVVVPTQARYQTCALGAVEATEVTLQIIACVTSRPASREAQAHVDQRPEYILAEVAGLDVTHAMKIGRASCRERV